MHLIFRFLCGLLFLPLIVSAQKPDQQLPYRMNVRLEGSVPHGLSNKAFRRSFTGVYELQFATSVELFSGFSLGVSYRNALWNTPDNKIQGINTNMQTNGVGLQLGYDKRLSRTAIACASLTAGRAFTRFTGLVYETDSALAADPAGVVDSYSYNYGEMRFGVYFFTEGNFAIGLNTGVTFTNFGFDPYELELDQHKAYIESDLNGNLVQLNLGIHVLFGFIKKQGAAETGTGE
ncbi:MAG: hypothetical protein IM638_17300 [Bacteroidetes bacterium]|nr:hypothetical protein [Bacteroidota bacterium]